MATIFQFQRSLNERETRIKYQALDMACAKLGAAGRSHSVRKVIAQRMLRAMEKGERDPERLCTIGLAALGPANREPGASLARERSPFPAA
jgi:hypothetical protein